MASEVGEFYKNKNIFITGGTGFLGIALIEKLLRTTPNVSAKNKQTTNKKSILTNFLI